MVLGFQYEDDAQTMLAALAPRLGQFGLSVHEGKTRLIEFGRFAATRRASRTARDVRLPGFTHYCGETRKGAFMVKRKTQKARQHAPVNTQHQWLCQVLRGHYGYYGVIFNSRSLHAFYDGVKRAWFTIWRRSQKSRMTWQRFTELLRVYPLQRAVIHQSWHGAVARPQDTFQRSPVR